MFTFTKSSKKIKQTISLRAQFMAIGRSCIYRHLSWFFVGLSVAVAVWIVFVWYQLFQVELLSQEERTAVRAQYANTVFERGAFDDVIAHVLERQRIFAAPAQQMKKDVFFSEIYEPSVDKQ